MDRILASEAGDLGSTPNGSTTLFRKAKKRDFKVGAAPRAALADYRVMITDWEDGRGSNRYPPTPTRYPDRVLAVRGWRLVDAGAARLARSANPTSMQRRAKGAKWGSGKLATQSRPYPLGQHVVLSLPERER